MKEGENEALSAIEEREGITIQQDEIDPIASCCSDSEYHDEEATPISDCCYPG